MAITFGRKESGMIKLFVDGKMLANESMPLIASPMIGQEIWFNAQDWNDLDTGFRGSLDRFFMYADALSPKEIGRSLASKTPRMSRLAAELEIPHLTASPWALLLLCVIIGLLLLFFNWRRKVLIGSSPHSGPDPCRANSKERSRTQADPRYHIQANTDSKKQRKWTDCLCIGG